MHWHSPMGAEETQRLLDLAHRVRSQPAAKSPVCAVSTISQFLGTCYVPGEVLDIQYLI